MAQKEGRRKTKRFSVSMSDDAYEKLKYWAEKKELSFSEFIEEAVDLKIAYINGDYDLPMLEARRLNQIIDVLHVLSGNVQSLEETAINGFDSLLGLTRGDNYLLEEQDGDI